MQYREQWCKRRYFHNLKAWHYFRGDHHHDPRDSVAGLNYHKSVLDKRPADTVFYINTE